MSTDPRAAERFTEDKPVEAMPLSALDTQVRAEFDVAIATAKRFPRSLDSFLKRAEGMATVSVDVAAACEYTLPRKKQNGEKIQGPSIRLAEIVAAQYGNLRIGARIIEEGETHVVAQGIAHDLESNVSYTSEVRRGIRTKEGKRYTADMIGVTCNAACAVALRNAIFKAIPFALIAPIAEKAKAVAIGTAETLKARRDKLIAWFAAKGIDKARVFAALEVKGEEDINLEKMHDLNGIWNAVRDGETSLEEAFPIVREGRFTTDEKKAETKTEAK